MGIYGWRLFPPIFGRYAYHTFIYVSAMILLATAIANRYSPPTKVKEILSHIPPSCLSAPERTLFIFSCTAAVVTSLALMNACLSRYLIRDRRRFLGSPFPLTYFSPIVLLNSIYLLSTHPSPSLCLPLCPLPRVFAHLLVLLRHLPFFKLTSTRSVAFNYLSRICANLKNCIRATKSRSAYSVSAHRVEFAAVKAIFVSMLRQTSSS